MGHRIEAARSRDNDGVYDLWVARLCSEFAEVLGVSFRWLLLAALGSMYLYQFPLTLVTAIPLLLAVAGNIVLPYLPVSLTTTSAFPLPYPFAATCFFVKAASLLCILNASLQFVLRNESFGRFILKIKHMLTKDIQALGIFFVVVVLLVTIAHKNISVENPFAGKERDRFDIFSLFSKLVQEAAQDESNIDSRIVRFLTTVFHLTVNIIMMNLLTASMSSTFAKYNEEQNYAIGNFIALFYFCGVDSSNCLQPN
jgi:hypothetical protein